jgi:hypothetical protein
MSIASGAAAAAAAAAGGGSASGGGAGDYGSAGEIPLPNQVGEAFSAMLKHRHNLTAALQDLSDLASEVGPHSCCMLQLTIA